MSKSISYKDIPKMMAVGHVSVKFAAANALNDVAFDSVRKIPLDVERDLNFRGNARRALGFRVNKARARRNIRTEDIEAQVWTSRGWVYYHVTEGTRQAKSGWKYRGSNYFIIPRKEVKSVYFTNKGKLRAKYKKGIFIIPNSSGKAKALVMHKGRRSKDTTMIGVLTPQADHHEDLNYDETIDKIFKRTITRRFSENLDREIRRKFR